MSEPKKPQRPQWPLPSTSKSEREAAGRVVHDDRGNAVWDWSRSPTDSTTHLLKKLDAPDLSLVDETPPASPPSGGIDPYFQNADRAPPSPKATAAPPKGPAAKSAPAKPDSKNDSKAASKPDSKPPADAVLKQLLGKR